jgi:hypothetical protein
MSADARRPPSKEKVMGAALAAARAQGCVCRPELKLVEIEPGFYTARLAHDDWCPLLRAREDRN